MKTIILAAAIIWISACDTVEDMREILDAQEQMRGMVQEEIGVLPLVGFTTDQGVLIDVSVAFSASDVADRSVSELVYAARKAVADSFDQAPQVIYLQLVTQPVQSLEQDG